MKYLYIKGLLNIICLFGTLFSATAQTVLNGRVLDNFSKEPLIGASILVKGTTSGTVTDVDGQFELDIDQSFPITLIFSYTGYASEELEIVSADAPIVMEMQESAVVTEVVEVRGQRVSDKQKAAPLTVESLDILAIKETPSDNFYDGLGALKGVDLTAASLGFKVINTRGFNSTSPVRTLQLIDGVDNQSPGLNFSLGNFLGSPELDVLKVDLIQGASSSFYGPNAFNGVISMETKNPFLHRGLAVMVKGGERNLFETALRYAESFQNKAGNPFLAFKINAAYLRADDWEAQNFNPVDESRVEADNPGRFDAVNIYGDEYSSLFDFSNPINLQNRFAGLGIFYRKGYQEPDLVDYGTRNLKANTALHWKLNPSKGLEATEAIGAFNYSQGTTVYQGDNRFSLRNIQFYQARLEIRKPGTFFVRAYTTWEDAGDSYDPYFTALQLLERSKDNPDYQNDYSRYWQSNIYPQMIESGYPEGKVVIDPNTGIPTFDFDPDAAQQWLEDNNSQLLDWHTEAADATDQSGFNTGGADFFEPGTARFDSVFREITTALSNETEGGTRFFDRSQLYHVQGEYTFTQTWFDNITVGGNGRWYLPDSRGTVFSDEFEEIRNSEFGMYAGASKTLFGDKLTLSATIRVDKNQNFNWVSTPAASVVWKPAANNYLRFSFSSAVRNPTLSDQYLFLDVGPAILSGNLNGADSLVTLDELDSLFSLNNRELEYFSIDPVQPEKVKTFELGYRTTLFNSLYVDMGYYFNIYDEFLGFILGVETEFSGFALPSNVQVFRFAANAEERVRTQGFNIGLNYYFSQYYSLNGNYSWNKLITEPDDPIVPAFNTPEHKFNVGISGRDIPIRSPRVTLGFNVNYKWIEGFLFEGSPQFTGFIPTYDLLDAQVNVRVQSINTTFKIGASNLLDNRTFQTFGGPEIGRLAYVSITYDWRKN